MELEFTAVSVTKPNSATNLASFSDDTGLDLCPSKPNQKY